MSIANEVYDYTAKKLDYLQKIAETGAGRGMLASFRRGVGKEVGELPELWGMLFDRIPDDLLEKTGAEWAIYTALTLYALHQQGNEKPMHYEKVSVGLASAKLVKSSEDEERILNRLNLVVTATAPSDVAYHLRGVIYLLRNEEIPLDYARLAKELYLFRFEESRNTVCLNWGRDFYRERNHYSKNEKGESK